jgi:hypothetical protein
MSIANRGFLEAMARIGCLTTCTTRGHFSAFPETNKRAYVAKKNEIHAGLNLI